MSKPALENEDITKVRKLIIHWQGKLTWQHLVVAIKSELGIDVTRQSLCKYEVIKQEYNRQKEQLRGVVPVDGNVTVADATTIRGLNKKLAVAECERDMFKRDYEKAQQLLNRVIINAQNIPNLDLQLLFDPIDEDRTI
ncbi:hypothetical protein WOB70_18475 [Vibrio parahaemolyticus]|uniref:hypothetical protein n=1 Tax=Vibrio parahaemolyticus TaxID=670 RepID=UPI000B77F5A9|nr:hypothetical protein [Vibrio parahaemolyticus]EJG1189524.1 hypothetical protein [Vibrio parahaemolyticus]EKY4890500.1 hypothetical protein [Vibrio parahaemolyticus]OXD02312.1 hypothetical protein CA161_11790 [Vibrio parahaemolyticus]